MIRRRLRAPKRKVFGIGRNKTGTTSLALALENLGYRVGDQSAAEELMEDWAIRDFRRLIQYCRSADAFQDVPFSLDYTYQAIDVAFPGSRFVLTVRDSPEQWYESLTAFHTTIVGRGRLPTADDLREFAYRHTGWLWRQQQLIYGADETTLYDRELYTEHYRRHNESARDYFRHRPDDLLVLNLADPSSAKALCEFLDLPYLGQAMPHEKRSQDDGDEWD